MLHGFNATNYFHGWCILLFFIIISWLLYIYSTSCYMNDQKFCLHILTLNRENFKFLVLPQKWNGRKIMWLNMQNFVAKDILTLGKISEILNFWYGHEFGYEITWSFKQKKTKNLVIIIVIIFVFNPWLKVHGLYIKNKYDHSSMIWPRIGHWNG